MIATLALLVACGNDPAALLQTVQTLEAKGDHVAAIAELSAGLRADPRNGVLHYHRGRIYGLMFDGPAAEHEFRKASEYGAVEGGRIALGLGRALLQQRKYRELITDVAAAAAFERSILASVHALRGHALMTLDRIGEAKEELAASAKLEPGNADVVLLQARFKAAARDVAGALELVEKLLAQDARNVEAWIHRADLLTISGKPQEAIVSFSRGLSVQPRHLHALVGRAIVLVQAGRLVDAQKDVDTLRNVYPKHPVSAYLRGQIHYWRGEYREALDMALGALRINQDDDAARLLSGMANMALDAAARAAQEFARYVTRQPRNESVQRVLVDLQAQISQKERASRALASIHSDELRKASVQAVYGDAYIHVWQHSKAADWLERAATSSPADPLLVAKQAQRRFSREQLDSAASDLERIVALSDEVKAADVALVLVQLARNDTVKAIDAVSAMEKKSPLNPQAATLAGIILSERNQRAEAARRFDEALERDPKLIAAVVGRARLDMSAGQIDQARKRFEDVLKADPDNLQALVIYAHLEEISRRRSEAYALLNRAVKAHPNALEPKVLLIGLLKRDNAKARALAIAEEVLAAHQDDPIAIEVAADIQLWNGNQDLGLATLRRLVSVRPKSPESYFKLARAQFGVGLKAEADANLYKALTLPIQDPEPQRLLVSGLIDDSKTLEAIESARKSFKIRPAPSNRAQLEGELLNTQIGGGTLSEALSGARGNR